MWKVYQDDRRHLIEINSSDVNLLQQNQGNKHKQTIVFRNCPRFGEKNILKYTFTKILFWSDIITIIQDLVLLTISLFNVFHW